MTEEILQVKRSGEFYYPIYFEEGFDRLTGCDTDRRDWKDGTSAL